MGRLGGSGICGCFGCVGGGYWLLCHHLALLRSRGFFYAGLLEYP